ncbi:MAG: PIN domain-containing protein [Candidatus Thermoplasmatota archaeon]|jgi:predicted nucleic acid-binding protein|nr:PIN domain-containing protein [Candidatus Thermoplasmatota archaeon]MDP7265675.1 PIN domain-containing protein [Candidatus Thermoplasmatota archaeon]
MSYDCVFDSYAWIEYFRGSPKGEKVRNYVENEKGVTPMIVIAELSAKYNAENWDFWEDDLHFIMSKSYIYNLNIDIAERAGKTRKIMRSKRRNFGLADAIILETGKAVSAPVITGDPHFKGLDNTIFIGD